MENETWSRKLIQKIEEIQCSVASMELAELPRRIMWMTRTLEVALFLFTILISIILAFYFFEGQFTWTKMFFGIFGIYLCLFLLIFLLFGHLPLLFWISNKIIAVLPISKRFSRYNQMLNEHYEALQLEFRSWLEREFDYTIALGFKAIVQDEDARYFYDGARELFKKLLDSGLGFWYDDHIPDPQKKEWENLVHAVELDYTAIKVLETSKQNIVNQEKSSSRSSKNLSRVSRGDRDSIEPSQVNRADIIRKNQPLRPSSVKVNRYELNSRRIQVGEAGEEIVVTYEKQKLEGLKLDKLALQVDRVSISQGDGLGYDIISFDENGSQIYIEVKTTTKNEYEPIFFTPNELQVMNELKEKYYVYRIYDLSFDSEKFELNIYKGEEIPNIFKLEASQFKARLKTDQD